MYQVTLKTPTDQNGNATTEAANTGGQTNATNRINATTNVSPQVTNCTALTQTMAHEIGHTFGLGECSKCTGPQQSVMIGLPCGQVNAQGKCVAPKYNDTTFGLPAPTSCDNSTVNRIYFPPPPPPHCPCNPSNPFVCNCNSPIILDIDGEGFFLTSAQSGVRFDISGSGTPAQIAWTAQGAHNAFLALPGPDGLVHNGKELFGNFTPQPPSDHPNGFAALAVYDQPSNGGNGDGVIDSRDAIFSSLRLWIDSNHDGIAQPEELHTLPSLGVNSLSLRYRESAKTDQYGNKFRYRAAVNPDDQDASSVGRTAYDVFLITSDPLTSCNFQSPGNTQTWRTPRQSLGLGNVSTQAGDLAQR